MSKKKQILFVHQNFPAQFKSLAPALAKMDEYEVFSLSLSENKKNLKNTNFENYFYSLETGNNDGTHRLALEFEAKMLRAEAAAKKCISLKNKGLNPSLIISHPGWGETLFLQEIWPDTKLLNYFEFYYHTSNSDVDFDNDKDVNSDEGFNLYTKLIARNSPLLASYIQSDALIAPTKFQAGMAPDIIKDNINIIHDGVQTKLLKPYKDAYVTLSKSDLVQKEQKLTKKDKIITFVNRNLEPYRGYHIFMRSLPEIMEKHPDAYVLIIGGHDVSYGARPPEGTSYKNIYFDEVKDDLKKHIDRVRFLGRVDYQSLLALFAVSSVHVYFTYPFVLSWSMLEAMAMECLVIGSKTEPVEEVIKDSQNGFLIDFFDSKGLSAKVNEVLDNKDNFKKIRANARKTIIKNYDLDTVCLPKQIDLVESLIK